MFTGIISNLGEVVAINRKDNNSTMVIACDYDIESIDIGASIACSGACLTVTQTKPGDDNKTLFSVDVSPETMDKTTLGKWVVGQRINLERAMRAGDEFGGHIVSGHVDLATSIVARHDHDEYCTFHIAMPAEVAPFIAEKGSICLDGTSLTVNAVAAEHFELMLIPHTLAVTNWGSSVAGTRINLEVDTFARYAARHASFAT